MDRRKRWMGVLLGFAVSIAGAAAHAVVLPASNDAEIRANAANTVLGGRNTLTVREAQQQETLILFDLSGQNGSVADAVLSLPVTDVFRAGTFEVRRLLAPWSETMVTFNTRPALGSQIEATKVIIAADAGRNVEIDLTATAQDMINNPGTNYGVALVPVGPIYIRMDSKEAFGATGPTLTVTIDGPPPPPQLVIENVFVNGTVQINGQNFDNGDPPAVSLSNIGPLVVNSASANQIIAQTPAALPDGDYLLTVTTGALSQQSGTFDLTIGAVGNTGPQGPQGKLGPMGATGTQGVQGKVGAPGATGTPGAQGVQGKIGPAGNNGANGAQGVQGKIGPPGPPGTGGGGSPSFPAPTNPASILTFPVAGSGANQFVLTVSNSAHFVRKTPQNVSADANICSIAVSGTTPQDGMTVALIMDQDPQTGSSGGAGIRISNVQDVFDRCSGQPKNIISGVLLNTLDATTICTYRSHAVRNGTAVGPGWICED